MKKLFSLIIFALLPLMASAYDAQINGIYYNFNSNTKEAIVTSRDADIYSADFNQNAYTGSVAIPERVTYNGITYSVTSIGDYAFALCSSMTSVIIPNSVTSIEQYAFAVSGISSVTIGNGVTSIGSAAFFNCSSLTSFDIPNSVTTIGNNAFQDCTDLISVTIGSSVTEIGQRTFYGCYVDRDKYKNNSSLDAEANNYWGLTFVDSREDGFLISNSVLIKYVGSESSVAIPNSVTSIGERAFNKCTGLNSIEIPNSVKALGRYAFYNCYNLTSVNIPSSVTSIGENAFNDCYRLTSLTIGNGVTSIGNCAFQGCSGLTSVTIPNSVTSIGNSAFQGCSGLNSIEIPNSVKALGRYAFYNCYNLTSVNIPGSVTSIGECSFNDCLSLTSVKIGNGVTSIGSSAFYNCSSLTSVTIPNSVTEVGRWAFYDTPWYKNLPDGLIYIGMVAYEYRGTMPKNTSITLKEGTTSIESSVFSGCTGMTSVIIPNSVISIGDAAFQGCSGLTSVTIPNSVKTIGYKSFYDCPNLTSVILGNGLLTIGEWAFNGCSKVTSLIIPNSVTTIGRKAFSGWYSLSSVTIGSSVTSIEQYAFELLSGLIDVYCYAKEVPNINDGAFYGSPIGKATLHVPAASLESYKTTAPWSYFGSIVALDDEPVEEGIAIDETNFPDANFRNWILSQEYGLDGVLTDDEIASASKISFPDIRVQSLKGIEYFTALGTLYFCDSPITTLDISKNTELTYLGCQNCQLASLDVSKNTKLTSLYCNGNSLTSLDVSQNTALKNLAIYSNQIKGAEMDALIESLPTVSGSTMYAIYGIDEQNEMTTTQVAAAKAKGWTPKYMVNGRWQDYAGSEPEVMKCASPVVAFYGGKLVFMCETEDVEYKYQIATPLMSEFDGTNVSLPTKIQLIIYATKDGYEPSDTVTKEIDLKALIGQLGDVNGDGEIGMADVMFIVNYILNGKFPNE